MQAIESRIIDLSKDLILVRSTADNPEGLAHGIRLIQSHVEDIPGVVVDSYISNGLPSFVARPATVDVVDTMMVAHVDVVEAHPNLFYPVVEGRRLYGRGSGDMKGQIAIITELFKDILQSIPNAPLGLMITTDEESGGENGVNHLLNRMGVRCAQAIIPDSGTLNELVVGEKGLISGRIVATGKAGHSSRPWNAENAVHRLVNNLDTVCRHFADMANGSDIPHWHPTLSVNILKTENQTMNLVPDSAEATVDLRYTEAHNAKEMVDMVNDMLDPHTRFSADIIAEPLHTVPDRAFLAATEAIIGEPCREVQEHGGSDGRYFTQIGIPVIMSRPLVGGLHSDHEWIDIDSMVTYYRILHRYLSERFGGDPDQLYNRRMADR
jgi:succinyl-diaminopimelate desuccinylase